MEYTCQRHSRVNGTTTTVKSNIVQIADKAIELASVVSTQFTCTAVSGSNNIVAIAPTLGLIPGMEVTSNTAGITVPAGTIIVSITNDTAVLSNNVTGSGTPHSVIVLLILLQKMVVLLLRVNR